MYRIAMEKLYKWKDNMQRKPPIITGARQVGTVYIDFESEPEMAKLFEPDLDTDRLIS